MDRCDADQEGTILPPIHYSRILAREEALKAIDAHRRDCPVNAAKLDERLRNLEVKFYFLFGCMVGSGLIGGTTGALIIRLLNP